MYSVPDFHTSAHKMEESRQMESTLADITTAMNKFGNIVVEQGQTIDRIDDNMDTVNTNVDAGQNELLKLYKNMSSDRGFIVKVFLTLMFLIVVFLMVKR